ncbi:MAG TPA: OB-fold domain-containing protein [Mycobacteriales bacterium]|nr:OB-fold domain-containing protein [Mycobacteriales bacterium]
MTTRPLPALTPENVEFWTAGEHGELRIQRCGACGTWRHPPGPICANCASTDFAFEAVSGTGTVAGVSINHHQWLPDFPPPYVVVIVALDEDPRVRVTSNVIDCDPGEVSVGSRVQVGFEQHDDVWLPLFRLVPGAEAGQVPQDEDVRRYVRPMLTTRKFEDDSAITGIGKSRVGRRLMVDPLALAVEACTSAVADAGLTFADIDGLSTYPGSGGHDSGHSEGGITAIEEALRIRPTWINGGMEIPGQSGAIVAAMLAVSAGLCRHVLCVRTVWESTHAALAAQARSATGSGSRSTQRVSGDFAGWRAPFGAMSAANLIGMYASNHFARYGTTREALGWISTTERAHAALNPDAIYRDPMTMEDYLSARLVSTPFGLYDCDVPCDGSIAVVVSARDAVADLPSTPVYVDAVGTQICERISWDQGTLTHEPQVSGPAAHLWTRTSLRREDVDLALLYDGFTFNCLSWLEALGFCGIGEGAAFVEGGTRISLGGELPLNTHGGQLSAGRTHGFGFVHEAVTQLRGDAGERQVHDAQVAVVSTGGGTPGGALLLRR